jgi:hypothetical protein
MSNDHARSSAIGTSSGRPPANRAIAMLGCLAGAFTLLVVTFVAAATGTAGFWVVGAPIGAVGFSIGAWRAWRLVALHGYFHEVGDEEEDEDGNPEGGSGVRFPPDAPDGGGSLEFDWDAFVTGFWDHVDAMSRDSRREPALP